MWYSNQNWLRITRVLTSTRLLGLEEQCQAFFDFLKAYRDSGRSGITAESFGYWESAALGELESSWSGPLPTALNTDPRGTWFEECIALARTAGPVDAAGVPR